MSVLAALLGLLGALAVTGAVLVGGVVTFGQHVGAAYEGLTMQNVPNTPSTKLPGGSGFAYVVKSPTLKSMGAMTLAIALWLLPFVLLHATVAVLGIRRSIGNPTWRVFAREQPFPVFGSLALLGLLLVVASYDFALTRLRIRADVATGIAGGGTTAAWMSLSDGSSTVGATAASLAGLGSSALVAISVAFAFALEFGLWFVGRAWERLGRARETLELARARQSDPWLDVDEAVIGARIPLRISRRTAILNPARFLLDDQGRIFERTFVDALGADVGDGSGTSGKNTRSRRRTSGLLSGVLFVALIGMGGVAAATELTQGPRVKLFVPIDFSKSSRHSLPAYVKGLRAMLAEVSAAPPTLNRHDPEASYDIALYPIDSFGGEPLWKGTELSASELTDDWWEGVLRSRASYGGCTSLDALWGRLEAFAEDIRPCDRLVVYLLSDLLADEPRPGRPSQCQGERSEPPASVPWGILQRATLVRAYGVPDRVKDAWRRALSEHDLTEKVLLFAGDEPGISFPVVRPADVCEPTEEDRATVTRKVLLWSAVAVVGLGVVAKLVLA